MSFSSFYSLTLLSLGAQKWNQEKLQFSSQDEKYVGWTCWSWGGADLRIPFMWGTSAFHRQLQTSPQTIKNQSAAAPQTAIGLKLAQNGEFYLLFKSSVTMALAGEVSHNSLTAPPSPPHREKSLWRLVLSLHCIAEECVLCPFKKEFFAFVDALIVWKSLHMRWKWKWIEWIINLLKILESCKVSRWKVCGWTVGLLVCWRGEPEAVNFRIS